MVGDFVGYNDLYTMFTGKDAATGKPRSRWIGAAWTAFNFIPISKVEKIAKVAKILVTARKGEKVAKDVRVGHLATRAITKRTGETAAKKAAQKRAEQLVKQRKKVKPVKAKKTKTPSRRVMSKRTYKQKYGKKVTKKQKKFNRKKQAKKARKQSHARGKSRVKNRQTKRAVEKVTRIPQKKINTLPSNIKQAYKKYDRAGWKGNTKGQSDGTRAGATFRNKDGVLPDGGKNKTIIYKEFDVNDKIPGKSRDAERFLKGSNQKVYYTDDHYRTFIEIK